MILLLLLCHFILALSLTSLFLLLLRLFGVGYLGGGTRVKEALRDTSSTEKGIGWNHGYVIIRKGAGLGLPGPGGKSDKKKAKAGKTAPAPLFS